MHAAAVAPGALPPDRSLPRDRRLRRPRDYAAVLAAGRDRSFRAGGAWLSITAAWLPDVPSCGARIGITVSRRMARRAIDRALVKRIVREAFRASATAIVSRAGAAGLRVDISVRLKRPLGQPGDPQRPSLARWRKMLREEIDQLLSTVVAPTVAAKPHA